jgi:hypothetical protein|tara:strand:+ start:218 stop:808 length:591 start_codon:yes stop_codon:yes gene_type:complete
MTTSQSPLSRQPTKLDYASPTQFRFVIGQLPKVEFFTVATNLPGITLSGAVQNTPFKDIPMPGNKLDYEDLTVTFIVDEFLENYTSLHEWLLAFGFPKNREQFSTFRSTTSNAPTDTKGSNNDIGVVGATTAMRGMFSDATLVVLSNKNNPIVQVNYADVFPTSLSALDFNQSATDVEYLQATATFKYKLYEIEAL